MRGNKHNSKLLHLMFRKITIFNKKMLYIKELNTVVNGHHAQIRIPSEATVTKLVSWNEWKGQKTLDFAERFCFFTKICLYTQLMVRSLFYYCLVISFKRYNQQYFPYSKEFIMLKFKITTVIIIIIIIIIIIK